MWIRCNARIPVGKSGLCETYCQRPEGHAGEHSTRADASDEKPPTNYRVVPVVRKETASAGPEDVYGMPGVQSAEPAGLVESETARCPHGFDSKGNCLRCRT